MQRKNQKNGTFSRTKDSSEEVGEQKRGVEWGNSSENGNTFLAAATSNWYVHTMISTHEQKKSFTKSQKEQPLLPAFFEIEGEDDAIFQKKSKKQSDFPNCPAERNRGQKSAAITKQTQVMQNTDKTVFRSSTDGATFDAFVQKNHFSAKSFQDLQNRTADIDRGQDMPQATKKDKAMSKTHTKETERKSGGLFASLSAMPIVNFFTSRSKKVTDSDGAGQESTLKELDSIADSSNTEKITTSFLMADSPHISPNFIKGMKLGEILFTIAAVVAHSRKVKVDCRIPWAFNEVTLELKSSLGMNALPSTLCGANEPVAYEEESFLYTPIPETVVHGGLSGYFQSGNYFSEIEPIIRHLFAPLTAVEKIPGTVGIHITIGNDPYKYSQYRLVTVLFLRKAVSRLSKDIREVVVFSDNPGEAVSMLTGMPEFRKLSFRVDNSQSAKMLHRMTAMQELVISNSALSWWAAWLGQHRRVISPRSWFMHSEEKPPMFKGSTWIVL